MASIAVDKYAAKTARNGYLWRVRFTYKDAYGRERPHTKRGFTTKKAAEAYGLKKFKELENTQIISTNPVTLDEIWKTYVEVEGQFKLAEKTLSDYKGAYTNHIQPVFGDLYVQEISYLALQKFFNDQSGKGYSYDTMNRFRVVLTKCFKTAKKTGIISVSPMTDIEISGKKPEKKAEDYLSPADYQAIEDSIKCSKRISEFQIENRLMFVRFGYYMGLRLGEIMGLKFSDIDWNRQTIRIERQNIAVHGSSKLTDQLKTPSSRAELPICDVLFDYLKEWRQMNRFEMIICTDDGELMPRRTMENFFYNRFKGTFHIHQLRHSFCTNLHLAGVDQITAASLSRHGSVEILNNIYTHPQVSKQKSAVDKAFSKTVISKNLKN